MTTRFIAEVSSNHSQDISRCYEFIDIAAEIGCDAVKFQLFRIDQLFSSEILLKSAMHRERKQWELPFSFIPLLVERAKQNNIDFCCTPFDLESASYLLDFVDFFKVSSYEMIWNDLIAVCAQSSKPLILSTGMATLQEVEIAVKVARSNGCQDLTLLHCVSGYPTPLNQCNLSLINTLSTKFNCRSGWSDHSVNPYVLRRAINKWNSSVIEFHLDIDGLGAEYSSGHCWLPSEIQPIIVETKLFSQVDGFPIKAPTEIELAERNWRADPLDGLRPLRSIRETF